MLITFYSMVFITSILFKKSTKPSIFTNTIIRKNFSYDSNSINKTDVENNEIKSVDDLSTLDYYDDYKNFD